MIGNVMGAIALIVAAVFITLVSALPFMLIWNWVMVDVLSLPHIGFLQSWGLMVMCHLMFKSDVKSN